MLLSNVQSFIRSMDTPFTSMASIEAAKRVLDGTFVPGFRTPVELFGSGFVNCVKWLPLSPISRKATSGQAISLQQ